MSKYIPKPRYLGRNMKIELDLSNYAKTSDLKKWKAIDTPDFAKKTDLANSKSNVDKLDIDKLCTKKCTK